MKTYCVHESLTEPNEVSGPQKTNIEQRDYQKVYPGEDHYLVYYF